jgi:hypothetical protein
MLQAHCRHPSKTLFLEGTKAANDQSGNYTDDLQGL